MAKFWSEDEKLSLSFAVISFLNTLYEDIAFKPEFISKKGGSVALRRLEKSETVYFVDGGKEDKAYFELILFCVGADSKNRFNAIRLLERIGQRCEETKALELGENCEFCSILPYSSPFLRSRDISGDENYSMVLVLHYRQKAETSVN